MTAHAANLRSLLTENISSDHYSRSSPAWTKTRGWTAGRCQRLWRDCPRGPAAQNTLADTICLEAKLQSLEHVAKHVYIISFNNWPVNVFIRGLLDVVSDSYLFLNPSSYISFWPLQQYHMILERPRIILKAPRLFAPEPTHHHYNLKDFVLSVYSENNFPMRTPFSKSSGQKDPRRECVSKRDYRISTRQ
jgi:hypothetical protein